MALYQSPLNPPFNNEQSGLGWLTIEPIEILTQPVLARERAGIFNPTDEMFKFLAPNEIQEVMSHRWEDYESLGARMSQLIGDWTRFNADIFGGLGGLIMNKKIETIRGTATAAKYGKDSMAAMADYLTSQATKNVNVQNYRIDTSLQYKGSDRRSLNFSIVLAETGDPYEEVYMPVRMLQSYASPSKMTGNYAIMIPHCFKVRFMPYISDVEGERDSTVWFEHAVITNIQPTWRGPYVKGLPSMCELMINLQELDPLYDEQYLNPNAGIIKVRKADAIGLEEERDEYWRLESIRKAQSVQGSFKETDMSMFVETKE